MSLLDHFVFFQSQNAKIIFLRGRKYVTITNEKSHIFKGYLNLKNYRFKEIQGVLSSVFKNPIQSEVLW